MTDTEKPAAEPRTKSDELRAAQILLVKRRLGFSILAPFLAIFLVVALFAASWFVRLRMMSNATVTPSSTALVVQMEQRITNIEQQVETLDTKLNELSARVDKNAPVSVSTELPEPQPTLPPAAATAAVTAAQAQSTAHMQSDLNALSAALATLEAEVKQTGSTAAQTQATTQNALAASIAFIQLRETADAGRGFGTDLAAFRTVAGNTGGIQEQIAKLEPYAANGAPTVDALREEFLRLEGPASIAVDKATAQNWQDRLLADLKSLISIRPLHGGATPDALVTAETALTSGDLVAALEAVKALPAGAQEVFKDWRSKAEARQEIDTALRSMVERFIAEASPASPPASLVPAPATPAAQDEP